MREEDEIAIVRARHLKAVAVSAKYGANYALIEFALRTIGRYQPAVARQHGLVTEQWKLRDHSRALVELHFMLIAMDSVWRGLNLLAKAVHGPFEGAVLRVDWSGYNDARNYFEHADDRIHGTRRNAPESTVEGGGSHTVEYSLKKGPPPKFTYGMKSIDISEDFLANYTRYVDGAMGLL
jgi:hypothetical protein